MLLSLWVVGHSQQTYRLGDLYNKDGVVGIVYQVSEDGQHGKIISCSMYNGPWTSDKKYVGLAKTHHPTDGKENMKIVEKTIADNNLTWDAFPVFKWAKDLGEGWYIPSAKELIDFMKFLMNTNENAGGFVYPEHVIIENFKLSKNVSDSLHKIASNDLMECKSIENNLPEGFTFNYAVNGCDNKVSAYYSLMSSTTICQNSNHVLTFSDGSNLDQVYWMITGEVWCNNGKYLVMQSRRQDWNKNLAYTQYQQFGANILTINQPYARAIREF